MTVVLKDHRVRRVTYREEDVHASFVPPSQAPKASPFHPMGKKFTSPIPISVWFSNP